MASKLVNDRKKDAEQVTAAVQTHASSIADLIDLAVASLLTSEEKTPNIALLIKLAGRALERATQQLLLADAAHTAELGDDDAPRAARDNAAAALRERLVDLRAFLSGLFGVSELPKLGFTQAAPDDAVMLSSLAGEVFTALSNPLPSAKKKGLSYDPSSDEDLNSAKDEKAKLDTALSDVKRETREAEATLVAKNRAIENFDETFSNVISLLVGLFSFAKQYELAERIRPLSRSRRTPTPTDA